MDNSNRYRVSTNFLIAKIIIAAFLLITLLHLVNGILNHSVTGTNIASQGLIIIILTLVFYYVSTRKRIDYDEVKQIMYIVDTKNQTETAIPVEKIDKILFSALGGNTSNSYVIVYRDFQNVKQKVRLFTIMFNHSIDTIKTDAALKNPHLVIRNWSVGINELFD